MNVAATAFPGCGCVLLCFLPALSHTNCFQFNENFNRKALWLPENCARFPRCLFLSLTLTLSLSLFCTCHNSSPRAVVVSVNVACIKCIKDADSHIWHTERERELRKSTTIAPKQFALNIVLGIYLAQSQIHSHSPTHSQQT